MRIKLQRAERNDMSESILDAELECPRCGLKTTVSHAIPDIDGEGSLGCPRCWDLREAEIVLESTKSTDKAN